MNQTENPRGKVIVFWVLWASILTFVLVLQFGIGGGIPQGVDAPNQPSGFYIYCFVALFAATYVRWLLLPKATEHGKALVLMITGLALAESSQIFQLFLIGEDYPQTQFVVFVLSILAVVQFAPFYANNLTDSKSNS